MKRNLLILLTLGMFATVCLPVAAQDACVTRCRENTNKCAEDAKGVYITCGQQGGSEATCTKKRQDRFKDCMVFYGCQTCLGGRWPANTYLYYCSCGDPGGPEPNSCGLTFDGGFSTPCDCNPSDPTCTSPIVIDVLGNGYRLTNVAWGVSFDLRATGTAIQTAWTEAGSDDAFLVLDRNGDGQINSGAELFGDRTVSCHKRRLVNTESASVIRPSPLPRFADLSNSANARKPFLLATFGCSPTITEYPSRASSVLSPRWGLRCWNWILRSQRGLMSTGICSSTGLRSETHKMSAWRAGPGMSS